MIYDVIIVGGGPGGLTAAVYASRARLSTLLIEKAGCGGQISVTDNLENYPGFEKGINGFDFSVKLEAQAKEFGTEIVSYCTVESIDLSSEIKKVKTSGGIYESKTVIIATGANPRKLGIPGEDKFIGNGVSFCATCDAPFFRNKDVLVVGGGDSALQEAAYLSKFAKNVILTHRRKEFRGTKILQERLLKCPNISTKLGFIPEEIVGSSSIDFVKLKNVETGEIEEVKVQGVFVFIGLIPNSGFVSEIEKDDGGYIITDENMKTSLPGVFACGDIRKKSLRQVVTAASDGAQAAVSAKHYIEDIE